MPSSDTNSGSQVRNLAPLLAVFACFTIASVGMIVYLRASPRPMAGPSFSRVTSNKPFSANTVSSRHGRPELAPYQRPTAIPHPPENPYTPAKELLGRTLFFDPRLSGSNWISCASCHNPAFSWGDGLPKAIGHGMQQLGRRTPTILDLAWGELMFWDGRAGSLEEQALGPIAAPGEMNMALGNLEEKLQHIAGYRPLFEAAFPGEPITNSAVARAIATYERTVVSAKAPFDAWVEGDENAISEPAKRGFTLFTGKANCAKCHSGWRFTDDGFHDIGIAGADKGRGNVLKDIDAVQYAFKTPTLRNVDHRGPFLHDGSLPTLEDVVRFYNEGGVARRPSLSKEVRPLNLSNAEQADLLSFLKTLTSVDRSPEIPMLPR